MVTANHVPTAMINNDDRSVLFTLSHNAIITPMAS